MKVKFRLRFPFGEVYFQKVGDWAPFRVEHVLQCLRDFTEVKDFTCSFLERQHLWEVKVTIPPISIYSFEKKFREVLQELLKRENNVIIEVTEMELEEEEIDKYTAALLMEKLES